MDSYRANCTRVVPYRNGFAISLNGGDAELLRTPGGAVVEHRDPNFLEHMVSELEQFIALDTEKGALTEEQLGYVTSYSLFAAMVDLIDESNVPTVDEIMGELAADPLLHSSAGPEIVDQLRAWKPIIEWMDSSNVGNGHARECICSGISHFEEDCKFHFENAMDDVADLSDSETANCGARNIPKFQEVAEQVRHVWRSLNGPQRVVVNVLVTIFGSPLAALAFVGRACTPNEFAVACVAGYAPLAIARGVACNIPTFADGEIYDGSEESARELAKQNRILHVEATQVTNICKEFLDFLDDSSGISALVSQGESRTLEFKETLGLDVGKGTKEKYIEESALKTIPAFLNSDGGTLLIGVRDDGSLTGVDKEIETLHKGKPDKFMLHFKNMLKDNIGEQWYPLIKFDLVKCCGVTILRVACAKSNEPCFINDGRDFYVRTNPSTDKLDGVKMVGYIGQRFHGNLQDPAGR